MINFNQKDLEKAMKRMGIQQQEIDAVEVIIRTPEKNIIIKNPHVAKVNALGQETFQITGIIEEKSLSTTPDITEEDIKTVIDQTGADKKEAENALRKSEGDIAKAILDLKQ